MLVPGPLDLRYYIKGSESLCISSVYWENSEYDQEIPQSQTAEKHMAPRGRATQQSRDTRKTNQAKQPAPSPHRDDRKTRTDTKQRTTKHRTTAYSHNGSNNKQQVNYNRTTALELTAA